MADNASVKALIGDILNEIIEEVREGGGKKTRVGLMSYGSELGQEELCLGARIAQQNDASLKVCCIGPKAEGFDDLDWIETAADEHEIARATERALAEGAIAGAVALHYPFPVGVTTIGKVLTPGRGRSCFIASSTGTASPLRTEAMLRNAIYGIAVAKSAGVAEPTVGILNLDGAQTVLRALLKLKEKGYDIRFAESIRKGGGAILRGNDLLAGTADVCVTDTLTGNVLMKLFGAWTTGGGYEAMGWGYGPSAGEGWDKVISIISRASGAPVIASALSLNAAAARNRLPERVAKELEAAKAAGLDGIIASIRPKPSAAGEEIKAPAAEPTDEEIHGVDVLEIENAVKALWRAGIYAESSMGCTGPVIKFAKRGEEKVKEILVSEGYL